MKKYIGFITFFFSASVMAEEAQITYQPIYAPIVTQSEQQAEEVAKVFIDPGCRACQELMEDMHAIPEDKYRMILVSAVPPTPERLTRTMWHLSSGGGLPKSAAGCQTNCATLSSVHHEDAFSKITIQENKVLLQGKPLQDSHKNLVFWEDLKGFVTSDGLYADLGKGLYDADYEQIPWTSEPTKTTRSYIETLKPDETGSLMDEDGEYVYIADFLVEPLDAVYRLARLAINTRLMKEVGGDSARVPSVMIGGEYYVLESVEQLKNLLGENNDT